MCQCFSRVYSSRPVKIFDIATVVRPKKKEKALSGSTEWYCKMGTMNNISIYYLNAGL